MLIFQKAMQLFFQNIDNNYVLGLMQIFKYLQWSLR